jgi:hypothetical protein
MHHVLLIRVLPKQEAEIFRQHPRLAYDRALRPVSYFSAGKRLRDPAARYTDRANKMVKAKDRCVHNMSTCAAQIMTAQIAGQLDEGLAESLLSALMA